MKKDPPKPALERQEPVRNIETAKSSTSSEKSLPKVQKIESNQDKQELKDSPKHSYLSRKKSVISVTKSASESSDVRGRRFTIREKETLQALGLMQK